MMTKELSDALMQRVHTNILNTNETPAGSQCLLDTHTVTPDCLTLPDADTQPHHHGGISSCWAATFNTPVPQAWAKYCLQQPQVKGSGCATEVELDTTIIHHTLQLNSPFQLIQKGYCQHSPLEATDSAAVHGASTCNQNALAPAAPPDSRLLPSPSSPSPYPAVATGLRHQQQCIVAIPS